MGVGPEGNGAEAAEAGTRLEIGGSAGSLSGFAGNYTPLYRAQNEHRYLRQALIAQYQQTYDCSLVVMIDQISMDSVTLLAEVLHDVDPSKDLHMLLGSPGGDGETAVRLARMAQAAGKRFVLLVPEAAKSAATILALGAHEIIMGPTSDLGPIDPQILIPERGYVGAKNIIAAVERSLKEVAAEPNTFPLHAAMLAGIDATAVQLARSALARTGDLARQAVSSNPDRTTGEVTALCKKLDKPLISAPHSHGALIGAREAIKAGLPVREMQPKDPQWQHIWAVWTQYFAVGPVHKLIAYEGVKASQVRGG
ncbi:serine dehydrogenase [Nocardia yunnanensis]|uniref:Serine dehydrogenase n=1 Tax=Nocardia yunnanensis TaxID=2382165 RepID=A0A386ZMG2_9NOCA|nr:serine dehydrogenase [Nocardia yunnanensis]AYF78513.1 serine dehydrogenase [Nocardia yunnanensis]